MKENCYSIHRDFTVTEIAAVTVVTDANIVTESTKVR